MGGRECLLAWIVSDFIQYVLPVLAVVMCVLLGFYVGMWITEGESNERHGSDL